MKKFLLAYDIPNKKRLHQIRKIAYTHSFGGQKSAVICIDTYPLNELKNTIKKGDKVNIIEVDSFILLGIAKELDIDKGVIFL